MFTLDLYARKVSENVAVGTTVQVVKANDYDSGKNGDLRYHIVSGNEAGNVLPNMLVETIALSNKSLGCSDLHLCRSCFKSNFPLKVIRCPLFHCNKIALHDNRTSVNY